MASIDGRAPDPAGKSRSGFFTNLGPKTRNSWLGKNWHTVALVLLLVVLAFFVRSYFAYSPSVDNGYLVSGGSDSYYHERVIGYVEATGQHLFRDPMLNYPIGMRNPRLPLYDWSVAVTSMVSSAVTGTPLGDSTGMILVMSTAFWGAITVVPVYLIGKAMFGRKAGLAAGFLLALMPGNIERSVLSNADHDAMILFFMVAGFFFLLMALKSIKGDKWVSDWKSFKSVRLGVSSYFRTNSLSTIYALLGGVCITAVGFIWEGFPYVLIIILVYFLFQLFINRFKNIDSMGVLMVIGVMLGLFFILAAPLYAQLLFWQNWFDLPLLLFIGVLAVGLFFVATRDYPWTLVVPIFVIMIIAGLAALAVFAPNMFEAIITGQGYLVKSKLYTTISEAQAANFSTLALSFGAVSFWLALIGLAWAAIKIPKNLAPHFIFIVVWAGAAMFMAMAQARFLFNATPVFAILAGWVLVAVIDLVKFEEMPRGVQGTAPWKHAKTWFKGTFKVKYVLVVFFVVVLILLPNVWTAVDAGIPSEDKKQYDLQVYDAMPGFLRPSDYDAQNGSIWYFGAFTYSLPMPNAYFPAAWDWFSQRDANITPEVDKPAFLSWWDYGFEAIQQGLHPTVADNFQNAFQFAGGYITCTDEAQAVSMLCARILQKTGMDNSTIQNLLVAYGVDYDVLKDQMQHPGNWISVILANPQIYGPFDSDMDLLNAMWISSRVTIAQIGLGSCADLYHDLRTLTGYDIGYFMVDSRLFPFSATGYNIFYAPAKLSDHRMDPYTNAPIDFYEIKAVLQSGEVVAVQNVTKNDVVVDYVIIYKQAFYDCMLYKAFMGYGPQDIGLKEQGIPGFSGSLTYYPSAQAWNQSHFRVVYRTAYFNPFPSYDVANHSGAWRAISYEEGVALKAKIDAGLAIGVVDLSTSVLSQGVIFVQYYDGVEIEGTVSTSSGLAYPNVYVTALDDFGVPHNTTKTDANGHYKVIAPFGKVTIVYSTGTLDKRTQIADKELFASTFDITYEQAMRQVGDDNGDGRPDWQLNGDVVVPSSDLKGKVYWDIDGSSSYTTGDKVIVNATVIAQESVSGVQTEATTTSEGYVIEGLPALTYKVFAEVYGHTTTASSVTVSSSGDTTLDIGIKPSSINGTVAFTDGSVAADFPVVLKDLTNGTNMVQTTDAEGKFSFGMLIYGNYTLQSNVAGTTFGQMNFQLANGEKVVTSAVAHNSLRLFGQAILSNGPVAAYATMSITSDLGTQLATTDASGRFSLILPAGTYSVQFISLTNGYDYVSLRAVSSTGGSVELNPVLSPGNYIDGKVVASSDLSGVKVTFQSRSNGAQVIAVANATGVFNMLLPTDQYFAYVASGNRVFWGDVYVSAPGPVTLNTVSAAFISGTIWYDSNHNSIRDAGEGVAGVPVIIQDLNGRSRTVTSGSAGYYSIALAPGNNYYLTVDRTGYEPIERSYTPLVSSVQTDLQLVPLKRTVQGTVSLGAIGMAGVEVSFTAKGNGAIGANVTSGSNGQFALSLNPGSYTININQDVLPGDNSSQYQFTKGLTVEIGKDPAPIVAALVQRYLITGTLDPDRGVQARVNFTGPESKEILAQTTFSLYLMPGDYSIYTFVERLGLRFSDLSEQFLGPASNVVSITTVQSYIVQGTLKVNGNSFQGIAPVNITKSTGGTLHLTTTIIGSFNTNLPAGNYTASVDFHTMQLIDTKARYVKYTGSVDFEVSASRSLTIPVQRQFDNSTLTGVIYNQGVPVSATIEFIPTSQTAMFGNASATQSGFSVQVAPGNYSLYVKEISGPNVFMGAVEVKPRTVNYLNISLVPGLRVSGTTLLNGVPGPALVEFSSANYKSLTSGPDGSYEVYLPADDYQVRATAVRSERGVLISYSTEFALNLEASQSRMIDLAKVYKFSVELQWNTAEKLTVNAGETVAYNIKVVNKGNTADTYALTAPQLATGWTVSFSQSTVEVDFGIGSNTQQVTVYITTPSNAKVSHSLIAVKASSQLGVATNTVSLDVGIAPVYAVEMSLSKALDTTGSVYAYQMVIKNTGNNDDTYNVTVSNLAELVSQGWAVEVRPTNGGFGSYCTIAVSAGSQSNFELRLTPNRPNPEPSPTLVVYAKSLTSTSSYFVLDFAPAMPAFTIPNGGLSVTGAGVSSSLPQMPWTTVALIGLVIAMTTIAVLVTLQKGVFKRRKR